VRRGEYDRIQRLYADTLTREYSAMSRTARAEKQYDSLLEKYHCLVESVTHPAPVISHVPASLLPASYFAAGIVAREDAWR
jgi:hypothetical protein